MPVDQKDTTTFTEAGYRLGRLSKGEYRYIRENHIEKPVEDIAIELRRPVDTIVDYCIRNKLKILHKDEPITGSYIEDKLYSSVHWQDIKKQLVKDELIKFVRMWCSMVSQLNEDILPSEEIQLRKMILLDISKDRALASQTEIYKQIEELQRENIREKNKKEEGYRERVAMNVDQLSHLRALANTYSKEVLDLSKEQNTVLKDLKASRSDRISNVKDSAKNWSGIVVLLQDDLIKKQVGKEIQLLHLAKEEAKRKLYQSHVYVDSKIDIPVLNHESIGELEESEDKNEGNTTN